MGPYGTPGPDTRPLLQAVAGGVPEDAPNLDRETMAALAAVLTTPEVAALLLRAETYKRHALSSATREAYERDFQHFRTWCEAKRLPALPAPPVAVDLYLTEYAEAYKVTTLARRLVAISRVHHATGYDSPTGTASIRQTFAGIARDQAETGGNIRKQASPVLTDDLRRMIAALATDSRIEQRDRALLLVGWSGALRPSEIGALTVAAVRYHRYQAGGMILTLVKSKTDQYGEGQKITVPRLQDGDPLCAVTALKAWLAAAQISRGPIFREVDRHGNVAKTGITRQSVTRIVKRSVQRIGLDPVLFSGHSLRAGLATVAWLAGAPFESIQRQGRWRSARQVWGYIRDADLIRADNAAAAAITWGR